MLPCCTQQCYNTSCEVDDVVYRIYVKNTEQITANSRDAWYKSQNPYSNKYNTKNESCFFEHDSGKRIKSSSLTEQEFVVARLYL